MTKEQHHPRCAAATSSSGTRLAWAPIPVLLQLLIACGGPDGTEALFEVVTDGRIAQDGGASRGVAWADFDADGDVDLVVTNTADQWNALYRNILRGSSSDGREGASQPNLSTPEPRFVKLSDPDLSPWGQVASAGGRAEGASWIDYDGDGDLDLYITTRGRQSNLLFRNEGGESLERVTRGPLVESATGASMACWADVDGDGWLDVFLAGYGDAANTFYQNLGEGVFRERLDHPLHFGAGAARACAWGDPNDDGLPDLYVGNAREPNNLFWNRGAFRFEEARSAGHLIEDVGYTYGLSWADYDEDGDQDLFVANFDKENVVYRNDGTGRLEAVREGILVTERGGASKGHTWGDYDLDGDIDLFVANGTYAPDMRNFIYLNQGGGSFQRDFRGNVAIHADTSAGAAWADYDKDGDLDVFVANWGSSDQVNRLYRNTASETTGRSWIALRLRSSSPNTQGWGAKVRAHAVIDGQPRWMTRWHVPTTGYGSQNDLVVHFGLGQAETVDSLVIRWPSGRTDTHTALRARTVLTVTEGAGVERDPTVQ